MEEGRWTPPEYMLPMEEGKCPPEYDEEKKEWYYPEPDPDYVDPELVETRYYKITDKEEFYGYVVNCKYCFTQFQAYGKSGKENWSYCPGCGSKLK